MTAMPPPQDPALNVTTAGVPLRVLVSVRNLAEAQVAAQAGVGFIDLKEPADGALGGLPPSQIAAIVAQLRRIAPQTPVTATIGDWPAAALEVVTRQVERVAAAGPDHVKVGLEPGEDGRRLTHRLVALHRAGLPVVPVLLADRGVDEVQLQILLAERLPAVMLDTADKRSGSLLQRLGDDLLAPLLQRIRTSGALAGLAGALRREDLPRLNALAPDFAGFRSAVCAGDRRLGLDAGRLSALLTALATAPEPEPEPEPVPVPVQPAALTSAAA
jgi:uncharacterized protein (UPF0264 family)